MGVGSNPTADKSFFKYISATLYGYCCTESYKVKLDDPVKDTVRHNSDEKLPKRSLTRAIKIVRALGSPLIPAGPMV